MQYSNLVFYRQTSTNTYIYKHQDLKSLHTYQSTSFSVVMSTSAFLVWRFPNLTPPNQQIQIQWKYPMPKYPHPFVAAHPYRNNWIQILCSAIQSKDAIRCNKVCYFRIKIDENLVKKLFTYGFIEETYDRPILWKYISKQINQQIVFNIKTHILFLSCSQHDHIKNQKFRMNLKALYYGIYFNNQNWKSYNILLDERPTQQDYSNADLIIIPGSSLSVLNPNSQIEKLLLQLKVALDKNKKLKMLGVCYGHQLMGLLLNGAVGKAKKPEYGECQIEIINKNISADLKFLYPLRQINRLKVSQYHSDQISKLPNNFINISYSQNCEHQIIVQKNGRFLGIQCHPQYTPKYVKEIFWFYRNQDNIQQAMIKTKFQNAQQQVKYYEGNKLREVIQDFIASCQQS